MCARKEKNYKVLRKLPLLMPQREREGGEEKKFIYALFQQLGCNFDRIKICGSA